jgi:hypothetical protein
MSILDWIVILIGCLPLDCRTFVLSTQAAAIRGSTMTNSEKGAKLASLVMPGMTIKQAQLLFGATQPLILSTGIILNGHYWYLKYDVNIYCDRDGKVVFVQHASPFNPKQNQQ